MISGCEMTVITLPINRSGLPARSQRWQPPIGPSGYPPRCMVIGCGYPESLRPHPPCPPSPYFSIRILLRQLRHIVLLPPKKQKQGRSWLLVLTRTFNLSCFPCARLNIGPSQGTHRYSSNPPHHASENYVLKFLNHKYK